MPPDFAAGNRDAAVPAFRESDLDQLVGVRTRQMKRKQTPSGLIPTETGDDGGVRISPPRCNVLA
jgi:hypothetical protein